MSMKNSPPILIVDDDEDIREILRIFLEADGYRVIIASDGCEAWKCVSVERPRLIILDWMMPHMDGEQFLKRLRPSRFGRTPVIVLSGSDSALQKARTFGAISLKKPVEFDELISAISRYIFRKSRKDAA